MEPALAPVVLRYFPIVGRAQPLRHALLDAGIAFTDLHVERSEWPAWRDDAGFAGLFGSLPTLTWGDTTVGETLAIASFLARRLGHHRGLDDAALARLEGICSNCYLEVSLRLGEVLWADVLYPGADLAGTFPRHFVRMLEKLARVEALLPAGAEWLVSTAPTMADFFAAEAIEALRYVLGPDRDDSLRARLPALLSLADRVRARPAIARAWSTRPRSFSSRPGEVGLIAELREL